MNKISVFLFAILFPIVIFGQVAIDSKIDSVTLFRSGAQVTRSGSTQLPSGRNEVIFKGLSSEISENSLQVSGKGDFTILSVQFRRNFLDEISKQDTIKMLEVEKISLEKRSKLLNAQYSVFKKEEAFLSKNMVQIVGIENNPAKSEDVERLADFHRKRMNEVLEKQLILTDSIAAIQKQAQKITSQISALSTRKTKPIGEVIVVTNSAQTGAAGFDLSYYVPSASWQPNYEARVKNISAPVILNQKAGITQNTGEDWKNVSLTLSTGNPSLGGTKPNIQPWYLGFYNPYGRRNTNSTGTYNIKSGTKGGYVTGRIFDLDTREPLIGATIYFQGTDIGTITDIDGNFSVKIPANASTLLVSYTGYSNLEIPVTSYSMGLDVFMGGNVMLEEVVVTGYGKNKRKKDTGDDVYMKGSRSESSYYMVDGIRVQGAKRAAIDIQEKLTTFNYKIKVPVSIKSDGKTQTVDVQSFDLPADYQYYAVPKLDNDAFLVGRVTDWETFGLLSAEASLFFEGTYLGKSFLDFESTEDTLSISLGRDKNILVERTKMKDFTKRRFLASKREDSRSFEITIVNKKPQAIKIRIEDQFPISENKSIEIKQTESTGASVNEDTGITTWDLNLNSQERKKLKLNYSVKYPKNKRVILE